MNIYENLIWNWSLRVDLLDDSIASPFTEKDSDNLKV